MMKNTLFLHSDVEEPFAIYSRMLAENPVFWDELNNLWAVYSYRDCVFLLNHPAAQIPSQNAAQNGKLNRYATVIVENLARLGNPPKHSRLRQIAALIFEAMQSVDTANLLDGLIENEASEIDWVAVCKKLPVLTLLRGFGLTSSDCEKIARQIEPLTKIMLPVKTDEQISSVNIAAERVYLAVADHLEKTKFLMSSETLKPFEKNEIRDAVVSNLIGLLIQSCDAGRGLLSNSLLRLLRRKQNYNNDFIRQTVIETVRYDSPVHNTRRILVEDVTIGEAQMKKGQPLLLILAAANRDAEKFSQPDKFDIERANNSESLTFGAGGHACLAKHFSINLTVNILVRLLEKFPEIRFLEDKISYEPLVNVRLPIKITIKLK